MELKKEIRILGRRIEVEPRAKENLKGITVGEKLSYSFYEGTYQGMSLLFVKPKKEVNPSPRACAITGKRLTEALGLPAVFILAPGPTYERHRLADKGVFFVMSEEYAHLPGIIALEKTSNRKIAEVLTPVAQYMLLYHLQVGSLEGMSPRDIAPLLPYSYESVTLGVTCLEDVGLCQKIQNGQRSKVSADVMENPNIYDGNYIIEIWKYPVVSKIGDKNQWVDRLSLVLTLREDNDPRVEKEVERIISEQKWTD